MRALPNQVNIVIRSIDIDITAIILGHMHHLQNDSLVWMPIGTGKQLKIRRPHEDIRNVRKIFLQELARVPCNHRL